MTVGVKRRERFQETERGCLPKVGVEFQVLLGGMKNGGRGKKAQLATSIWVKNLSSSSPRWLEGFAPRE